MELKGTLLAILAAVSLFASTAGATTATFAFTGTVTYGGSLAAPGTPITGIFSYKTNSLPIIPSTIPSYHVDEYDFSAPHVISAEVGGHSIISPRFRVTVTNNFGGNVEDVVNITGMSVLVDDVTYPDGSFGFQLATWADNTGVLHNTRLPSFLNVQAFDAPEASYGWLQRDGDPDGQLLQFTIDRVETLGKSH